MPSPSIESIDRGPEGSVRPGLHKPEVGAHKVVWWDPSTLELDKQDPEARERGIGDGRQAFPRAIIEDGENPEAPPANELIRDKIERPPVVWSQGHRHWCPRAKSPFAAAASAHHEPFLPVDAEKPLVVDDEAFPSQEDEQAPVAEAPALPCQCTQPLSQGRIIRPP